MPGLTSLRTHCLFKNRNVISITPALRAPNSWCCLELSVCPKHQGPAPRDSLSAPCWDVVSTPGTQGRCLLPPLYPYIVARKHREYGPTLSIPKYLADHPLSSLAALRVWDLARSSVLQTLLRNARRGPSFLLADSVFLAICLLRGS